MIAAIPYDNTNQVHFGIDAIAIDEWQNDKEIKRTVNRHIISCLKECDMPGSMLEDELARYDYYLVSWELYEKINEVVEACTPSSAKTAIEINNLVSKLYQSLDIRTSELSRTKYN